MTDEQIIKDLEIAKGALSDGDIDMETFTALNNAIDFINRQKAENEELRSDKIIAETHEKAAKDLFVNCTRQLEEAKAELKQLQETLDEYPVKTLFDKNNLICSKTSEDYEKLIMKIANSTIKEFATRLCKGRVENDPVVIATKAELDYVLGVGLEVQE